MIEQQPSPLMEAFQIAEKAFMKREALSELTGAYRDSEHFVKQSASLLVNRLKPMDASASLDPDGIVLLFLELPGQGAISVQWDTTDQCISVLETLYDHTPRIPSVVWWGKFNDTNIAELLFKKRFLRTHN